MRGPGPIVLFLFSATTSLLSPQSEFPKLTGPYFGQKLPGRVPEVFAPGIMSFPDTKEFACAFSPDGKECEISILPKGQGSLLGFEKIIDELRPKESKNNRWKEKST